MSLVWAIYNNLLNTLGVTRFEERYKAQRTVHKLRRKYPGFADYLQVIKI